MPESDVGDGAAAAENADTALAAAGEGGDAVHDVAAVGDLHDVRSQGVGAVPRDDDRRLRLVLGSGGPAARPASILGASTTAAGGAAAFAGLGGGGG